ncbi:MAG: hypothetical protein IJ408_04300 [Clostridia bacterium]|nr:hypothetical protein [Clostridia bacterium]
MAVKRIGNIERVLISECVKDTPDFGIISKLFDMGADVNAVNEFGECTAAIVFEGYCSLYGGELRSGYYVPSLLECFFEHGFDVRRHGLKTVSELQNCCYDKYVRKAIAMILEKRRQTVKCDCRLLLLFLKNLCRKNTKPPITEP